MNQYVHIILVDVCKEHNVDPVTFSLLLPPTMAFICDPFSINVSFLDPYVEDHRASINDPKQYFSCMFSPPCVSFFRV